MGLVPLVAQTVKRLSTMQETRVQSLGQEDPLEKETAIHSSTIAWKIPWTEELGGLQSMRHKSRTRLSHFTSLHFEKRLGGDFPSGPVVKTLPSNAEGTGWIPSQGIKIPCDLQCGKRKKKSGRGLC